LVLAAVRHEALLAPGEPVLVAVSGGPDSVALLSVLTCLAPALNLTVHAVHFNFGLRGTESDEDADFVAELCARLEVNLTSERLDLTGRNSQGRGSSIQERARQARYARLTLLAGRHGATRVALGHTADDHAETVCMWMVRGAGLTGLGGIPSSRDGLFVRPLLGVSREQILAYLAARGLAYRSDSSNAKNIYFRNRIRHEVLPLLKRENPALLSTLHRQAELLKTDDRCLDDLAAAHFRLLRRDRVGAQISLDRVGLTMAPLALQRRVVRLAFREARGDAQGPSFRIVESIVRLAARASAECVLTFRGLTVTRGAQALLFAKDEGRESIRVVGRQRGAQRVDALPVHVPSTVCWTIGGRALQVHVQTGEDTSVGDSPAKAGEAVRLDADRFTPDLVLRAWQPGDRFQPAGMGGHQKKLQDFFTNLKVPRSMRGRIPLLVAPEGILWVVGYRADQRFVATEATRRVLATRVTSDGLTDSGGRLGRKTHGTDVRQADRDAGTNAGQDPGVGPADFDGLCES
jgi:tRNA(Ile)-lysidine synthase